MKTISHIKKNKIKVSTTDIVKISKYLKDNPPIMGLHDHCDDNANSHYLVSDSGKYIAKINYPLGAVGFYKEKGNLIKHLSHIDKEELGGETFTIAVNEEINLIEDVLPQGDIIIKLKDGRTIVPDDESVSTAIYMFFYLVDKIIYTGISEGNGENYLVDFESYKKH